MRTEYWKPAYYPANFWALDKAIADYAKQKGIGIESVYHDYKYGRWILWSKKPCATQLPNITVA